MNEEKLFYEELKSQRKSQNLTLEEISDFTKIDIKFLIGIEQGNFSCLPRAYMRLFLRSYCEYISADVDKALNDYEFFTLGNKTETKTFVYKNDTNEVDPPIPPINEKELDLPQVPTTKIITILITIAALALAFFFVRYMGADTFCLDLPEEELLSGKDFRGHNFEEVNLIETKTEVLTESSEYTFKIEALAETKIFISYTHRDKDTGMETIVNIREIVDNGYTHEFVFNKEITFRFWSACHVKVHLNDTDISEYFGSKNQSIKGWFSAADQKIKIDIFKQAL